MSRADRIFRSGLTESQLQSTADRISSILAHGLHWACGGALLYVCVRVFLPTGPVLSEGFAPPLLRPSPRWFLPDLHWVPLTGPSEAWELLVLAASGSGCGEPPILPVPEPPVEISWAFPAGLTRLIGGPQLRAVLLGA